VWLSVLSSWIYSYHSIWDPWWQVADLLRSSFCRRSRSRAALSSSLSTQQQESPAPMAASLKPATAQG
jgi:hypothetical protein